MNETNGNVTSGCECLGYESSFGECFWPSPVFRIREETERVAGVLCQEKVENDT